MCSRAYCNLLTVTAMAVFAVTGQPVLAAAPGERMLVAQAGLRFQPFRIEAEAEMADSAPLGSRRPDYTGAGRLGIAEPELSGATSYSLDEHWTSRFATGRSGANLVHDRRTLHGLVERNLSGGWGLGLGLRRNDFLDASSNALTMSAGGQWGDLSGAYTLFSGLPDGLSTESRRLQLSYRYTERGSVGLAFNSGREMDYLGPLRGLSATEINNWSLGGRHRLTPSWALTYDMVRGNLGSLQAPGLKLGLRHDF